MKEFVITEVDMVHLADAAILFAGLIEDHVVMDAVERISTVMEDAGHVIEAGEEVRVVVVLNQDRDAVHEPSHSGRIFHDVVRKMEAIGWMRFRLSTFGTCSSV